MSHLSSPWLRCLRSGVLAATAVLLAVAAHVLGGGTLPTLSTVALAAVPLGCAAVVTARRRCGPMTALVFLGLSQWAMHHVLSLPGACAERATSSHHTTAVDCAPAHVHAGSTTMAALHVLATIATALLLVHGENALVRVWTWLTVRPFGATPALPVAVRPAPVVRSAPRAPRFHFSEHIPRRGPPARRAVSVVIA